MATPKHQDSQFSLISLFAFAAQLTHIYVIHGCVWTEEHVPGLQDFMQKIKYITFKPGTQQIANILERNIK